MSGNVQEWVSDWYGSGYYATSPATNPTGPATGTNRVLRGGTWLSTSGFERSSFRNNIVPSYSFNNIGFRVAKNAS